MSIYEENLNKNRLRVYQQLALEFGGTYYEEKLSPNYVIFEYKNWKIRLFRKERPGYQFSYHTQILAPVSTEQDVYLHFARKTLLDKIPAIDRKNIKVGIPFIDDHYHLTSSEDEQTVTRIFDEQLVAQIDIVKDLEIYIVENSEILNYASGKQRVLEILIPHAEENYGKLSALYQLTCTLLDNLFLLGVINNLPTTDIFGQE